MYTSFKIRYFRQFRELKIENLRRCNLFTGLNNSGKSTVLEALWMHSGPNRPDLALRLLHFRGVPGPDLAHIAHDIFFDFDTDEPIELTASGDWGEHPRVLKITVQPKPTTVPILARSNGRTSTNYLESGTAHQSDDELILSYCDENQESYESKATWKHQGPNEQGDLTAAFSIEPAEVPPRPNNFLLTPKIRRAPIEDCQLFDRLVQDRLESEVIECLKLVDHQIRNIRTMTTPEPMIYADVGLSRFVPVGLLGDGIGRLFSLALAIFDARGGLVLVDELENGLHHTVLEPVWQRLRILAEKCDVQLVATTHSSECLFAAMRAFHGSSSEDLAIHRLDVQHGQPFVATFLAEDWDYSLKFGAEMR